MNISISKLKQRADVWHATLAVGDSELESDIVVTDNGDLRSFRIVEPIFKDVLSLCGLDGSFSRKFFGFINNGSPEVSWCLGEQDDKIIERVSKHYQSSAILPRQTM